MGAYVSLSINFGILLGFIAGHYLSFFTVPKFAMCFQILYFCTFAFFPESPIFLVNKDKFDDANKALQMYRNSHRKSYEKLDSYENELVELIKIRIDKTENTKITWKDFRKLV